MHRNSHRIDLSPPPLTCCYDWRENLLIAGEPVLAFDIWDDCFFNFPQA